MYLIVYLFALFVYLFIYLLVYVFIYFCVNLWACLIDTTSHFACGGFTCVCLIVFCFFRGENFRHDIFHLRSKSAELTCKHVTSMQPRRATAHARARAEFKALKPLFFLCVEKFF